MYYCICACACLCTNNKFLIILRLFECRYLFVHVMHRQYQEVCKAQQEASARNKLLLEDVNRLQRQFSTPAKNRLQQLKVRQSSHSNVQAPARY